jgi:hypothetical protein
VTLAAMADVDRSAAGLLPFASFPLPAVLSALSLSLVSAGGSSFEPSLGVFADDGPDLFALDGRMKLVCRLPDDAAEVEAVDCDRCLIDSSEGFRLRSWLFDDRWPGV